MCERRAVNSMRWLSSRASRVRTNCSALRILAVNDDWFHDDVPLNADGKRVMEALAGRWIVEAAELNGMRKGEVEHLKAFLSRTHDRARMSYDSIHRGKTPMHYYWHDQFG